MHIPAIFAHHRKSEMGHGLFETVFKIGGRHHAGPGLNFIGLI
ncbi:hypothetical protein D3OALGA1CA_4141 [Olavius algarvensis associated proteobacterium Delta 3]|nr:hypothetical protein D3OALGB2SA_829 [Olavius algarvensis associated proteobacterium Delta 3]CAB5146057.1 hypothetical protein D3OALGA1CA_4141 [Olavius algarvensis associated proteobacterium Delta 3]